MVLDLVPPDAPGIATVAILAGTVVTWFGSQWFEESAERLSAYYGLPAVVQGSVVVAVGSSFPELASVVFTALSGVFDMGVGAIVGSAIFNILVIPAASNILSDQDLEAGRAIVYKEALFYMVAVAVFVLTLALAVIYEPVPTAGALVGELTRLLALIPLLLYGLYLFIQWQDVSDYDSGVEREGIAVRHEWRRLLLGLLVILIAVELLVSGIESAGQTFGVPDFLAGVTILAAATSLPDLLVSVRSAQAGRGVTSLGNVFGSNTFDLLVAIPIGVLIVGTVSIDFAVAVPMIAVLTVVTVILFTFLRTDLSLSSLEAYILLVFYLLFVGWIFAETVGLTQLLGSA
ncbi:sodium:calcium antiporter [Haladaptatus sp. DJG-WS-42]|uniref:sodium:calcium antiporter n=1 Tax=Haladaptatus sp. DJG-WS-42 TaxID=3120516 RepID=UPI0030D32CE8